MGKGSGYSATEIWDVICDRYKSQEQKEIFVDFAKRYPLLTTAILCEDIESVLFACYKMTALTMEQRLLKREAEDQEKICGFGSELKAKTSEEIEEAEIKVEEVEAEDEGEKIPEEAEEIILDYSDKTPKELYQICVERQLRVKKGQKLEIYIQKLEADDVLRKKEAEKLIGAEVDDDDWDDEDDEPIKPKGRLKADAKPEVLEDEDDDDWDFD